ncbi:MAG: Bug family tripartite tricarboxylate transporter substrate binding protein [Lautropia sp.]
MPRIFAALFALSLTAFGAQAQAQTASYPDRAVRIVVPFAPGGPTDLLARLLAKKLQDELSQNFVVENRPGAGGVIGTGIVAKSAPDGYTLLLVANNHAISPSTYAKLTYDPSRDFAGVGMLGTAPYVLVARPDLAVATLDDLRKLARSRGAPMLYGTPGSGTANHLAVQLLSDHFGVKMQQVDYSGAAPATQGLLSGQVDFIINNLTSSLPLIQSRRLVAIGLTGPNPSDALPGVPPIASTIPGYEALAWYGIVAPAGTPREALDKLGGVMAKALDDPSFRGSLAQLGVDARKMSGAEFDRFVVAEIGKWTDLARRAGVKPE